MFIYVPANPSAWTLKPAFEDRERIERRMDKDLTQNKNDKTWDLLSRVRVGATLTGPGKVTGKILFQESHDLDNQKKGNFSTEREDIVEGWLKVPVLGSDLYAGRFHLVESSMRLLSDGDFNNFSTSYDGAKLVGKKLDLFYAHLALASVTNRKVQLGGTDYRSPLGNTLVIYKNDDQARSTSYTFDHYYIRPIGKLTVEAEYALQRGRMPGKDIQGFADEARLTYKATPKLAVFGEYLGASGGSNAKTSFTFDQIYSACHNFIGVMDMNAWKNTNSLDFGVTWTPSAKTTVVVKYLKLNLMDASDAWYAVNNSASKYGTSSYIDPTGGKGKDVGQEYDIYVDHKMTTTQTIGAGLGLFQAGNFVKAFHPTQNQNNFLGYVYWQVKI